MPSALLNPSSNRFCLFPIKYHDLWDLYKKQEASLWKAEEIDIETDSIDWNTKLTENEKTFIMTILAFFANADGIVNENIFFNFVCQVQIPEARAFYGVQTFIEQVHNETYNLLIDRLISNTDEKMALFRAIDEIECVQRKANWAIKWLNSDSEFGHKLIAFACVEGIFFSASFASIFWLKKRGIMPGLCVSNEFISRDEGLHCKFACRLYHLLDPEERPSIEEVKTIIKEAVACEEYFVKDALKSELIGMNAHTMIQYVKFTADYLAGLLGILPIYNVQNPFEWMDMISLQSKDNFFEKRVSDYRLDMNKKHFKLDLESDF
jgi:ribonucleotide reductase beta subunit family protein with ferritin-like domain